MSELVGTFYIRGKTLYLIINKAGTVEKWKKPSAWRVLKLFFLQKLGRVTHLDEVREYLRGAR